MVLKPIEKNRPSPAQTLVSAGVMTLLAIICGWLFISQFDVNPAVKALLPNQGKTHGPTIDPVVRLKAPLYALAAPETFDAGSLYEKINGRADLYLTAGFKALAAQRIGTDDAPDQWMEFFVYDMGKPTHAFSVYSLQKREGAAPSDITENAYFAENAFFMSHGPYYVEIIGTDRSPALLAAMEKLARQFTALRPIKSARALSEIDLFPETGLQKETIALIPANGFGFEKLNNVYVAEFIINDTSYAGFISRRESDEQAKQLAHEFTTFLTRFGGTRKENTTGIENAAVIEIMDTIDIIFYHGPYMAGVHEGEAFSGAVDLANRIHGTLQEALGKTDAKQP